MKRLFCVKDKNGKIMLRRLDGLLYFINKMDTKQYRDELEYNLPKQAPFRIARGPDHWRGES